jgi:glycosyltransferase involved in cell wall biosynthesis/SAM-dependent methyltransferase
MHRVALVQPYVPSYSLPFFDGLAARLADDGVELTVYHSPSLAQARSRGDVESPPWSVTVSAREFRIAGRVVVARRLPREATDVDLLILEQALGKVDAVHLVLPRNRPVALLGHGHIHNRSTSSAEESLLRRLTARADWFFAYTAAARDDALRAGLPSDRITVFENSTDTVTLSAHVRSVTDEEVEETRRRLGLGSGPVMLFLGSIDESKRPEFLIRALAHVWDEHAHASLVLVGEGSSADQLQSASGRVVRAGRLTGKPLAVLASAADVIVMPGRVGLVATDSFALGVPIVTTSWPFHSPEFAYLINGVNALITRDDSAEYGTAVARLLNDRTQLATLKEGCRRSAQHYSTENMVELFRLGVVSALKAGPRPNQGLRAAVRRAVKALVSRVPPLRRHLFTSTDYAVGERLDDAHRGWSRRRAVHRQDKAWERVVAGALAGDPRRDISALWQAIDAVTATSSVLEVGSGHGYLADLLRHHQPALRYVGVDISWEMCRLARSRHPGRRLVVGDAIALPFADRSVETVLDAATLMHVPDWRAALREEARVARSHLILHSVTVADIAESLSMRKYAYGVPVFEGVLSRRQLSDELSAAGFAVIDRYESLNYDLRDHIGVATTSETVVCVRTNT